MTPAEQIAAWADKLRDISAMGLHFSKNIHDEGAFRAVQNIAMEMLAFATGETLEQIEALRAPIFSHPTPFATGDAAVIDDQGRILLIRRADNGKWAMPAGRSKWARRRSKASYARLWKKPACTARPLRSSVCLIRACAALPAAIISTSS